MCGLLGEIYGELFYGDGGDGHYEGFRVGFSIAFFATIFEILFQRSARRGWIKRLPFLPSLILRVLIITVIVRVCLVGNDLLTSFIQRGTSEFNRDLGAETRDTIISLLLVVFFVAQTQFFSLVGVRRFYNLLLGRYFKPVDEERIFVFVDMLGSSKAANELGNTRFHQLLSDFFFHIDRAIVRSGGEIVSYVGDAVIITWPLSDNMKKNAAPFRAIAEMLDLIDSQKDYFEREYGQVPQFRAALHCGAIVVGECGDSRRQITFLGDVVNVTARIEQASKDLDIQYLASADLIRRMHVPENVRATKHGPVNLKGVDGPVVLYDIEFCRDK